MNHSVQVCSAYNYKIMIAFNMYEFTSIANNNSNSFYALTPTILFPFVFILYRYQQFIRTGSHSISI